MGSEYGVGPVYPLSVELFGSSGELVGRDLLTGPPSLLKGGQLSGQWLRDDSNPLRAGWRVQLSDRYGNRFQVYWDGHGRSGLIPLDAVSHVAGVDVAGVELSEPSSSAVTGLGAAEAVASPKASDHLRAGGVVVGTAIVVLFIRWRMIKWRKRLAAEKVVGHE